ncbi:NAD(P)-dependent oxidoreductase [Pseudomonas mosselii]|uniref:NAD(P)-dependent oxidoreductase n=1 Tax=Pseudomonas mosselii TaxID=78327 RepID=UPI000770390F|nr:NAD(P)-dependent oxidoreductase [Pseudomonas mosselii]AMK31771.1 Pyridine nucleotide-disulfide oxidoreductase associated with reductive pyrimidine catabolism [Pseudomonas putida]MDH1657607.1 NAD(P)-dependent oxidoreductase [Pseudomonas mosselii]MDH1715614.1 NAD(P)-dependent oxidoreductase [Pseudomonas mosselii]MDH1720522.1 NAD(P)-dependent oxidoreductase [Pseudomonas mosselii]MDN4496352.1 NAD(P)-dependent oxidoreductase [Pseudomonas mosselii]
MIDALNHLPRPRAGADQLAEAFSDLAPPLTARQAAVESARCLYCYDAPCVNACPSEIDIPSFIHRISDENLQGAAERILSANILGGSCARVCPTEILCQQACVRNNAQECAPVLIGQLQRYALDHAGFTEHPFQRSPASGKRIAVVGAGPAGLSCAHRLAMHGHDVVIFEAREKAGGLNEYGIARYKLVDDYAQREVEFLLGIGGIEIRHGQRLGANLSLGELHAQHDAVFLGLGLDAVRQLGLADEDAPGLLAATTYIRELRQADDLTQLPLADRCLVLGAGNTAIDMAVQMSCLGARDVNLVYRRGVSDMGATAHEQEIAKHNQVRLHTWARPEAVLLDDAGQVRGMRFARTQLIDGRLGDTGETFELAADAIFKAIGQGFDDASLADPLAAQLARDGERIQVDAHMQTSIPGIYAGGDCTALGQDLTVQAVQHGKLAAEAIHAQLMLNVEAA